jgi:hypothetical protein
MATHELYLGGPSNTNSGQKMFPAAAFNNAIAPFTTMPVAEHKATTVAALTRTLAFGTSQGRPDDPALAEYVRNHTIAAADVLDLIVIPANTLLLGVYCQVENPSGKVGTITFSLDDGTTFGAAVDINAAFSKMVAPGGAWVSAGAVSLATANFSNVVRMLKATLTTLATDFGALRISVSPILIALQQGQY